MVMVSSFGALRDSVVNADAKSAVNASDKISIRLMYNMPKSQPGRCF